jgi:hypothetical protein
MCPGTRSLVLPPALPVIPYGCDFHGAATPVALRLFSDEPGGLSKDHGDGFRLVETDLKVKSQARITERAGQALFEELASLGRHVTAAGRRHRRIPHISLRSSEVEGPREYCREWSRAIRRSIERTFTVRYWAEYGVGGLPTLKKLARALGVPVTELLK